jgi:plasmid stabilization system protein ParE
MLDFTFNPLAEEEYGAAVERYAAGAGDVHLRFIETFEAAILQIREFPESGPIARGGIRSKVLSGFPYTIYYSVRPSMLRILAVAHQKRQPFYWLRRR